MVFFFSNDRQKWALDRAARMSCYQLVKGASALVQAKTKWFAEKLARLDWHQGGGLRRTSFCGRPYFVAVRVRFFWQESYSDHGNPERLL